MQKFSYLNDSSFLDIINHLPVKEQFVKITVLNWNEFPIQDIQGKVSGGSLNLDGQSSVRRTCNLTMTVQEEGIDFFNLQQSVSLNKKVQLFIGYKNTTNLYLQYDIIWFPLGTFVITDVSISHTVSGTSLSLQLKDKMCLLNGDCGGVLPASVTFHEREDISETGEIEIVKPTIYQIILEVVNHFGGIPLSKIIISDLDTRIKHVMKWSGSTPLYIKPIVVDNQQTYLASLIAPPESDIEAWQEYPTGRDVGYIYTDFTYPGELIGDAGQSVCDILDKIKSVLGNFEYFFDIDGNFIFQEIKNYLNTTQAKIDLEKINNDNYIVDIGKGKRVYSFDDASLITSYSNAPQYGMIKNDFVVWGMKTTTAGNQLPIRYHLAIDKKPKTGNSYSVVLYEDEDGIKKARPVAQNETEPVTEITTQDWRSELYLSGAMSDTLALESNYYYTELNNEWQKLYDLEAGKFKDIVEYTPYELDFFLDFIDTDSAIGQFSVSNIGRRSKVVVDDSVNCLFEPDIPDLVFLEVGSETLAEEKAECDAKNQNYIQVPTEIYSLITLGGTFNSAYNVIRDLLYQYTNYNEAVTIQAIPIYYLEPNIRIGIFDLDSGINGDYMIKSISLPLDTSGTMSISAVRVLEKI